MAKLVGVVHENEEDSSGSNFSSRCLARRQLPLTIEQDLTMIMALDDACLACCSSTLYDVEDKTVNDINSSIQTFLRKYEALNRDELTAALMVNFNDLMGTLSSEVSCVGCRRSVEAMLQKLHDSGDPALEPLVITDDKVISVNRDHILTPQALANLFCNQLHRLRTTYIEPITGAKTRKKTGNNRCAAHSLGLGSKKLLTFGHWTNTWKCMERECQEECVLIHFDLLRETIDRYLKKHSFCDECTKMVNKAYNMLVVDDDDEEEEEVSESVGETSSDSSDKPQSSSNTNNCKAPIPVETDHKKITKIYNGLTSCVSDQHVHVECKEEVVAHLIEMAEPELSGLRQERHAKTLEIAQKEVLTCIGICLYERFQRIQQRLREGQQACDLLFYVALQSLKHSFEMAFESKQGISDLEKLCQEFDEEDRKKQVKAQKKRDKKKKKKELLETSKQQENSPNNSNCSSKCQLIVKKLEKKAAMASCENEALLKKLVPSKEPISVLKLASILDQDEEEDDDEDENIPQEEIQQYLLEVSEQREELRRNLRQRFAQLCVNGL